MTKILMLSYRMAPGFGVSVVADALARALGAEVAVEIGAVDLEGEWSMPVHRLAPTPEATRALARQVGASHVIAHTSPFFEILPELRDEFMCVAWEHGDPTPAFFDHDRAERQRVKTVKHKHIYPNVDAVVAISRFVAADIDWPAATVIANGIDHVDAKPDPTPVTAAPAPLRVGTLMRLGQGEAYYKGNDLFLDLVAAAEAAGVNARFEVMGRGEDADAARFRARGLTVHLNASDAARDRYLRELDVFVTCSRWEGFNLPLLEAQAQGTPALAFDVGAHPETTPLLMASLDEMAAHLAAYDRDRTLVSAHGRMARRFASRFTWSAAANQVHALLAALPADPSQRPRYQSPTMVRLRGYWQRVRHYSALVSQSLRRHGVGGTLLRIRRRLFGGGHVNAGPTPPAERYSDEGFRQWLVAHDQPPYPARLALDLGPLAATARGLPTRRAGDLAPVTGTGHLILLSPGAVLHDMAAFECADLIRFHPQVALAYGDYDHVNGMGERAEPRFLPDWDADLFWATGYPRGALLVRADLWNRIVESAPATFEAAMLALVLAAREAGAAIHHIPRILAHVPDAEATAPRPRLDAHHAALLPDLARIAPGAKAEQEARFGVTLLRRPAPEPAPKIAVIIPTRDGLEVLAPCVKSVLTSQTAHALEVIIVDNGSTRPETREFLDELTASDPRVRILPDPSPFNFAGLNNRAVAATDAPLICFLNNDTEVITPDWLDRMAGEALRPEVGAVGARLLYPDGAVQHAGVILGLGGVAGHGEAGLPAAAPGHLWRAVASHRRGAVTAACLMIRREVFVAAGGFDDVHLAIDFNDVDLCLRLADSGLINVMLPSVELVHKESVSRGTQRAPDDATRFTGEVAHMRATWGRHLDTDPSYNPNLSIALNEPYDLAAVPRTTPVWKKTNSR